MSPAAHHMRAGALSALNRYSAKRGRTSSRAPKSVTSIHQHARAASVDVSMVRVTAVPQSVATSPALLTTQATSRPTGMNWLSKGDVR